MPLWNLWSASTNVDQRAFEIYLFGDEYISLIVEDYTYHLLDTLSNKDSEPSPENQKRLLALIDGEVHYRQRRRYASIPEEQKDNETLVFRRSVLKKYVASILFLDAEMKTDGSVRTLCCTASAFDFNPKECAVFFRNTRYPVLTILCVLMYKNFYGEWIPPRRKSS